jgi:hypothetical protein
MDPPPKLRAWASDGHLASDQVQLGTVTPCGGFRRHMTDVYTAEQLAKWTQMRGSKGMASLSMYRLPAISTPYVPELYGEEIVKFDPSDISLSSAVTDLLQLEKEEDLTTFMLSESHFKDRTFPRQAHQLVRHHAEICRLYTRLITEVIAPCMRKVCAVDDNTEFALMYQFPPTLRCHCSVSPAKSLGRCHNDAQYGHQHGEVNFWMPLSTPISPSNTLWRESVEGKSDWQPILLEVGEIQRWHGTTCRHFTCPNDSGVTRISMDFRVADERMFDQDWHLPGVHHRHEMRKIVFPAQNSSQN